MKSFSRIRLLATPWTAAHQAPPSMGFSRQEYWSGVPLPSPMPRIVKSMESESTLVGARGWGMQVRRGDGVLVFNGDRVSV